MPNINKNIIKQAGAAVANATNKAAGLSASTPEPGTIISAIQLVNGGRTIGPDALAHFTESVRNKLLSLLVSMEPIQSGSGTPSPYNVRPINGRTGLNIYVSPTPNAADANTYAVDWTSEAGTVYGLTLDVVSGMMTVDWASIQLAGYASSINDNGVRAGIQLLALTVPNKKGGFENIISDMFSTTYGVTYYMRGRTSTSIVEFSIPLADIGCTEESTTAERLTAGRQWMTDKNPQLAYELATPLTYHLTRTDIVTLVGDNYIWSDSGDVTITE